MEGSHAAVHGAVFAEPLILLAAAVVGVALSRRLGFGSILGYLAAGVVVGPTLRLITGASDILDVAELGIVLFLFLIGLELKPARLWAMRRDIFGLGLAQVLACGGALTLLFALAGWRAAPALIIGFGLAMSSTAFGMQALAERGDLQTPHGRKATAILLFQDIAVVPLLALVPFLSPLADAGGGDLALDALKALAALAGLILAGRYLLNPLFRLLAVTRAREIMTAAALLVVLGAAALMDTAGLSMAMGAFVAGLLLADSEFRHELEADIEPFRGILLGLFFVAVGMSIRLDALPFIWLQIALAVPVIMIGKASIIYGLTRLSGSSHNDAVRVALLLPQAGEFAFVLFASAAAVRALWPSETVLVAAIVTVTMALTPFTVMLGGFLLRPEPDDTIDEDFEGAGGTVLVVGFGRFGQIVSQILLARHIDATVIDANAERVRQASRFGFRIYFGDGTRRDVLRAAGAEEASIICVCVDKPETANTIVALARSEFPAARLFVRSWDRAHTLDLLSAGVDYELRETYESAIVFGGATLLSLGFADSEVADTVAGVRLRDADRLAQQRGGDADRRVPAGPRNVEPEPLSEPNRPRGQRRLSRSGPGGRKKPGPRAAAQ